MSINNEQKIMGSNGKVGHRSEDIFRLVRLSELSLNDAFLRYIPKTLSQIKFMKDAKRVIAKGLKDIYFPIFDPSLDEDGNICYQAGMKPAVGYSRSWWVAQANRMGHRLCTKSECIAFKAVLIKEMAASGMSLDWAWDAVCDNSQVFGRCWNKNSSYDERGVEATGSNEVSGWCDILNTYKIVDKDKGEDDGDFGFWLSGGRFPFGKGPLSEMVYCSSDWGDYVGGSTGLIVHD